MSDVDLSGQLRAVVGDVVAEVAAMPDAVAAFHAATDLLEVARAQEQVLARLRAEMVYRVWLDQSRPTMAALAGTLGVSTPRAHQLLTAGRPPAEAAGTP